jgi:hypothetical protein
MTFINKNPLDQFTIRNLLSIKVDLLGNLQISLTNVGLYLIITTIIIFMMYILATNYNLVTPNNWSISIESIYALVLIEFISYLSRLVSLGLRLGANILNSHMLLNIFSLLRHRGFCCFVCLLQVIGIIIVGLSLKVFFFGTINIFISLVVMCFTSILMLCFKYNDIKEDQLNTYYIKLAYAPIMLILFIAFSLNNPTIDLLISFSIVISSIIDLSFLYVFE